MNGQRRWNGVRLFGVVVSRRLATAVALTLILGLLLWAKLLLVTGYPRTAIATPDAPAAEKR